MNASTFRMATAGMMLVALVIFVLGQCSAYGERREAVRLCVDSYVSPYSDMTAEEAEIICKRDIPR